MNLNLLHCFLLKIYQYEENLFFKIRDLVGIPRMKIGDKFRFTYNVSNYVYEIRGIKKMNDFLIPPGPKKKQMVYYKYSYTNQHLYRYYFICYINDFLLDNNMVIPFIPPSGLEYSDRVYNLEE